MLQFTAQLSIVQQGTRGSHRTPELVWQMMATTWYCLNMHCRKFLHSYDNDAARNRNVISFKKFVDYKVRYE